MKWIKASEHGLPEKVPDVIWRRISDKWVIPADDVYQYWDDKIIMNNDRYGVGINGLEIAVSDLEYLDESPSPASEEAAKEVQQKIDAYVKKNSADGIGPELESAIQFGMNLAALSSRTGSEGWVRVEDMTRDQLQERMDAIEKDIKDKYSIAKELFYRQLMLCDDKQRYEEKIEIETYRISRKKHTRERLVGRIYWSEYFEDEDRPGHGVTVERSQIVRQDGAWIV